jgi:hypothetical protein
MASSLAEVEQASEERVMIVKWWRVGRDDELIREDGFKFCVENVSSKQLSSLSLKFFIQNIYH